MRKRLIALLGGVLALILAAAGLGIGLSSSTATSTAPEAGSAADETATTELTTLAQTGDDEESADDQPADETTPGTSPSTAPRAPGSTSDQGAPQSAPQQPNSQPSGQPSEDPVEEEGGDEGEQLPTLPEPADTTGPTITVKADMSVGASVAYSQLSLKLYDAGRVDYVVINGVTKDLSDNQWSDVNFLKVGSFGIQDGVPFTVVAFDVAGNSTTATFTLDATGPTITVKPESIGGPSVFRTLSLKLYDAFQVDHVVINGVTKDLTDNKWSDVNGLTVGQFGIQDGVPFSVVAFDVAGNSTSVSFTLDATGPTITVKPESVGGPNAYQLLSLKFYDRFQVDYVVINGVTKELANNPWSDVNGLTVGQFGIQDNVPFTVVAYDVVGNSTTATFVFDHVGPTISVKPESVGGPNLFSSLSLKLYDAYQVDYVVINGVTKDLANNPWSDANDITTGQYGIVDGTPFTVVAFDVLGNSTTATFTLDGTAPTATEKARTATSVSLRLFDRYQVDYVVINGVTKDLSDNQWSDANDIRIGTFGIQAGVEFTVIVVDVAGNRAVYRFTLPGEAPVVVPEPQSTNLAAPVEETPGLTEEQTVSE